jgi:serine/threonine protein phosphatase PrpC
MSALLPIATAGQTDRGLLRGTNEDGFLCEPALGLFAVADGLGGLPHGEVASKVALDELRKEIAAMPPGASPDWQRLFTTLSQRVIAAGVAISGTVGIGTTLTVAFAKPGELTVAHVGDSGLFEFPANGKFSQITHDHTMAQEMLDAHGPGIAESIPETYHHTLTQCIGQPVDLVVQIIKIAPQPGTRYLLYSDGVTKTQTLEEVALYTVAAPNPKALVSKIVTVANAAGGPDNVTAVALFY